jgi:hypothetical protein
MFDIRGERGMLLLKRCSTIVRLLDMAAPTDVQHEKQYLINIEGTDYPWDSSTITVPQLRGLGSIPADQEVQEIDLEDNTERTLGADEVVHLQPGKGFAKKVRFQRG